jgi:hypothetical protein
MRDCRLGPGRHPPGPGRGVGRAERGPSRDRRYRRQRPPRSAGAHIPAELITDRTPPNWWSIPPSTWWSSSSAAGARPANVGAERARGRQAGGHRQQGAPGLAGGGGLRALAKKQGVDLLYEAAVAGAIPLVRALRESLTGERIHRVMGIVNGTTNFILTKMSEQGADYADALAEAQSLGLAERDPTADVEGYDAAAKAAILAGVAFGYDVAGDEVMREGITAIRAVDIEFAERFGYTVKLLAVVERTGDDALSVRVHPALVPRSHPLAGVRDAFNAVFIEGEAAGELMLYGQGAGGLPTASAVVGDLIDATRNLLAGTTAPSPDRRQPARLLPESELEAEYYVSLDVTDRPGVLAAVTKVFGDNHVSIRSMEQEGYGRRGPTHLRDPPGPRGRRAGHARGAGELDYRRTDRRGHADRGGRRNDDVRSGAGRVARGHRGVPRRSSRCRPPPRWSLCWREGRPSYPRRGCRSGWGPGAAEGRGGQPHRLVQGPGHDGGHLQGGRGGGQGGGVRVDRQHVGVGGGLRGPGRPDLCRAHPRGAHRAGQAGPGPDPRGARAPGAGQLRPVTVHRARARRAGPGDRGQLGQPLPDRRARSRGPSRSSTRWATLPRCTASRWATPATSPPTGRAISSSRRRAGRPGCRACSDFRRPAPRPSWRASDRASRDGGHRHPDRQPGQLVRRHVGGIRVGGRHHRGHRRGDPRRLPVPRRRGVGVL